VTAAPARIDSKAVDRSLRAILWPRLKSEGFDRRTGRTTWRDRPDCVQTVNIQSFNSYLAEAIGSTTFSFSVNLGVFYAVIADHSPLGSFVKDRSRPAEHHCQARYHLAKGISQPNLPSTKRWFDPRVARPLYGSWQDRPDVWYVVGDGSNLDEVVTDARDRIVAIGLPWLERLSDLSEARRAFLEDPSTSHARGIVAEGFGGAIGSPDRWRAVAALSIALGDPDGLAWATSQMERLPYFQERPADLDALRSAMPEGTGPGDGS
jgi:hypothetical protein